VVKTGIIATKNLHHSQTFHKITHFLILLFYLSYVYISSYMTQRTIPPTFTDSSAQYYITTELIM